MSTFIWIIEYKVCVQYHTDNLVFVMEMILQKRAIGCIISDIEQTPFVTQETGVLQRLPKQTAICFIIVGHFVFF